MSIQCHYIKSILWQGSVLALKKQKRLGNRADKGLILENANYDK
jgi:hypothetical protein